MTDLTERGMIPPTMAAGTLIGRCGRGHTLTAPGPCPRCRATGSRGLTSPFDPTLIPDTILASEYRPTLPPEPAAVIRLTVEVQPQRWVDQANCADMDPDAFFPERGEEAKATAAKAVCASCEVKAQCLAEALADFPRLGGIWGGTTWRDRKRILATQRRGAA